MRWVEGRLLKVDPAHFVHEVRKFVTSRETSKRVLCLSTSVNRGLRVHQGDGAGGQISCPSAGDGNGPGSSSPVSKRCRRDLPRSTVYLSMRRLATADDITKVIGRALKREKDGVLEAPPECTTVLFLDDVHCAQEVRFHRRKLRGG